ncbi:MAG: glycosyltransferase family 2 protein [Acidobacteria bacterium]|nr:glycosyltransferase family 2 protein [Acidobacteriota bacterium]
MNQLPRLPEDGFPSETSPGLDAVPELSVVIPAYNEAGAILPLVKEVAAVLDGRLSYEIVVVDDASADGTADTLKAAAEVLPRLRVLRHRRRFGQSGALLSGVRAARAAWIATMDGDGQNDPKDLLRLWQERLERPEVEMICGVRARRKDNLTKRLASRVANGVRKRILKDDMTDTGCGLKLIERRLYLSLPPFDHMHRFLPALARAHGTVPQTLEVGHRPRQAGSSKYGILDRLAQGVVDLLGVWWLTRRRLVPKGTEVAPPRAAHSSAVGIGKSESSPAGD